MNQLVEVIAEEVMAIDHFKCGCSREMWRDIEILHYCPQHAGKTFPDQEAVNGWTGFDV